MVFAPSRASSSDLATCSRTTGTPTAASNRLPRAFDEGLAVVQRARGRAHRLVVEAIGAERDRVIAGVASEHAKAVREIRPEVTVAPGVQRVAVAGDASDNALDLRARGGCQ